SYPRRVAPDRFPRKSCWPVRPRRTPEHQTTVEHPRYRLRCVWRAAQPSPAWPSWPAYFASVLKSSSLSPPLVANEGSCNATPTALTFDKLNLRGETTKMLKPTEIKMAERTDQVVPESCG